MNLTGPEHELMAALADVHRRFTLVTADGPSHDHDLSEVVSHVHALQRMVVAQSAARAHPRLYRQMGGEVEASITLEEVETALTDMTAHGGAAAASAADLWTTISGQYLLPPIPRSYQRALFEECEAAGWDPRKTNTFAEEVAHLHEEVSEAFREWRLHRDTRTRYRAHDRKPEGVPSEFADVVIGLAYLAELHGFDLFAAVDEKHRYNLTRSYAREGRQLHPDTDQEPPA